MSGTTPETVHLEYAEEIWTDANSVSTPADLSVKLVKDDGVSKAVDQINYQSMVGRLLYATHVQILPKQWEQCQSLPTETAVKRILRYLKGTTHLVLKYQKLENGSLISFYDADWAGDSDDCHSTSGNLFLMTGRAVSWLSKKQAIVALSTSEAEYVALSLATQEAV